MIWPRIQGDTLSKRCRFRGCRERYRGDTAGARPACFAPRGSLPVYPEWNRFLPVRVVRYASSRLPSCGRDVCSASRPGGRRLSCRCNPQWNCAEFWRCPARRRGFGGCTVSIVKNDAVDAFIDTVEKGYQEKCGRTAEFYVVEIGDGAHRLA